MLPNLLNFNNGRIPDNVPAFQMLKQQLISWSYMLEPNGPSPVQSLAMTSNPNKQALTNGIYMTLPDQDI